MGTVSRRGPPGTVSVYSARMLCGADRLWIHAAIESLGIEPIRVGAKDRFLRADDVRRLREAREAERRRRRRIHPDERGGILACPDRALRRRIDAARLLKIRTCGAEITESGLEAELAAMRRRRRSSLDDEAERGPAQQEEEHEQQ